MLHERVSAQREQQRALMDQRVQRMSPESVYGRANDVYYSGFTQYGRDHLNEIGRKAEVIFSLRENWKQLAEGNFGKAISVHHEETTTLVGVVLPVESDNSRHLIIFNNNQVFMTEEKDHFEKQTYLKHMSSSEQPLLFCTEVDDERLFDGSNLTPEATTWFLDVLGKESNVKVVRSSDQEDDLIALEGVMEKAFSRVEKLRLENKSHNM